MLRHALLTWCAIAAKVVGGSLQVCVESSGTLPLLEFLWSSCFGAGMQAGPNEAAEWSIEEVAALLEEGKALGLQLKGLPKLISVMAAARAWNVRATRALRSGAFAHPVPLIRDNTMPLVSMPAPSFFDLCY